MSREIWIVGIIPSRVFEKGPQRLPKEFPKEFRNNCLGNSGTSGRVLGETSFREILGESLGGTTKEEQSGIEYPR